MIAEASGRSEIVPATKDGAKVITIRGAEGDRERGVTLLPISEADYDQQRPNTKQRRQQVEDGALALWVTDVLPMEQAPTHRRMEAGEFETNRVRTRRPSQRKRHAQLTRKRVRITSVGEVLQRPCPETRYVLTRSCIRRSMGSDTTALFLPQRVVGQLDTFFRSSAIHCAVHSGPS